MISPKELKALAKACREAGIKQFKNAEVEFTLSDDAPVSNYKKRTAPQLSGPVIADDLSASQFTDEQMLYWSATEIPEEGTEQ